MAFWASLVLFYWPVWSCFNGPLGQFGPVLLALWASLVVLYWPFGPVWSCCTNPSTNFQRLFWKRVKIQRQFPFFLRIPAYKNENLRIQKKVFINKKNPVPLHRTGWFVRHIKGFGNFLLSNGSLISLSNFTFFVSPFSFVIRPIPQWRPPLRINRAVISLWVIIFGISRFTLLLRFRFQLFLAGFGRGKNWNFVNNFKNSNARRFLTGFEMTMKLVVWKII